MSAKARKSQIRIGISGWRYAPWRGDFYPTKLPQRQELHFASSKLSSIEINGSFYSLQSPASYQGWWDETPDDFVFSLKAPRYITHIKRLRACSEALANFFASGVLYLRHKLGPILFQLPPNFLFREEGMDDFFKLLPRDGGEALELAKKSTRLRAALPNDLDIRKMKLRYSVEVRHLSFENPDFIDLLRKNHIALVFADSGGKWPYLEDITSDFLYLRLHGPEELYASGYDSETLRFWAERIEHWQSGAKLKDELSISERQIEQKPRDVFCYFDNDIKTRAPFDAMKLIKILNKKHLCI